MVRRIILSLAIMLGLVGGLTGFGSPAGAQPVVSTTTATAAPETASKVLATASMASLAANAYYQTITDLGWYLDAHGSVHCTKQAWHIVCDIFNRAGVVTQGYFDLWIAEPCTHGGIAFATGDDNGTPFSMTIYGNDTNHCSYSGSSFSHVGKCVAGYTPYSTWFEGNYYINAGVGNFAGNESTYHNCGGGTISNTKFVVYGTW